MTFLNGLTLLLLYQLIGEVIVKFLQLPIPGPVMGMLLLLVTLMMKSSLLDDVEVTANQLLKHLSLLFVPAGVGVMVYAHTVSAQWFPIVMTLLISTLITMTTVALVVHYCRKRL